MTCHRIKDGTICVCYANVFEFRGYLFEWHPMFGPVPVRKDGEPRKNTPRGFYEAMDCFAKLTPKQRERYRVEVTR